MTHFQSEIRYCCIGEAYPDIDIGYRVKVQYPKPQSINGSLPSLVEKLLSKIPHRDEKKIITDRNNKFFYSVQGNEVVMCITNQECKRRVAFSLIESLHNGGFTKASDLKRELKRANDPAADRISKANLAIEQVKTQMIENIDRVLERGNNLDQLLDSTNDVVTSSTTFNKKSRKLKRKMGMRLACLILTLLLIICFVVSALVIGIVLLACATIPSSGGCGLFDKREAV